MNRHLNIFRTYTKVNRDNQLENDLTRALAICLQESSVLLHTILRVIFEKSEGTYESLFTDYSEKENIQIDIQQNVANITEFNKLFAVSLSGFQMDESLFFNQTHNTKYEPITDLLIVINDVAIIFEVKPDNQNCIAQLYNQAYNACNQEIEKFDVIPVDLNWKKLIMLTIQVLNFKKSTNQQTRFIDDFIQFVQSHNHNWFPIAPFSTLGNNMQLEKKYISRLEAALLSIEDEHENLNYAQRIGLKLDYGWAQEIVIYCEREEKSKAAIKFGIWPGNTKGQGWKVIHELKKNPSWHPPTHIIVDENKFDVHWNYELKFCHFNGHVASLYIGADKIRNNKEIISDFIHRNHTGKYNRNKWNELEDFLDDYLIIGYDWRKEMDWEGNFLNSNRGYLTFSIGYQIETVIPISYLQGIDSNMEDLKPLSNLIVGIKKEYKDIFKNN